VFPETGLPAHGFLGNSKIRMSCTKTRVFETGAKALVPRKRVASSGPSKQLVNRGNWLGFAANP
jgi:hypothetical protein